MSLTLSKMETGIAVPQKDDDNVSASADEDDVILQGRRDKSRSDWEPMEIGDKEVFSSANSSRLAEFATTASWFVNWFILGVKIYIVAVSSSKAVTAALADSAVDLVSQGVLSLAESYMQKHSPDYPVGRSRLEALSVLTCAFIMSMASIEVIQFSAADLYDGIMGDLPKLEVTVITYVTLGLGIFLKIFLYIYCIWAQGVLNHASDILGALAEDHLNDVFSNLAAIVTAGIAFNIKTVWWIDPAGAILISLVIIWRWGSIMLEQVKKIVGHTAPPEFISLVEELAIQHDPRLSVDVTRAYHFGARYNVEMEIILPGSMTVMESHDIALALQHKIEGLLDVERAFVHVDHQERDGLEHKVERELVLGATKDGSPGKQEGSPGKEGSELRSRNAGKRKEDTL